MNQCLPSLLHHEVHHVIERPETRVKEHTDWRADCDGHARGYATYK